MTYPRDPLDRDLLATLRHPDTFQAMVDSLPPCPQRTLLRLWGLLHGVYRWSEQATRDAYEDRAADEGSAPTHSP